MSLSIADRTEFSYMTGNSADLAHPGHLPGIEESRKKRRRTRRPFIGGPASRQTGALTGSDVDGASAAPALPGGARRRRSPEPAASGGVACVWIPKQIRKVANTTGLCGLPRVPEEPAAEHEYSQFRLSPIAVRCPAEVEKRPNRAHAAHKQGGTEQKGA